MRKTRRNGRPTLIPNPGFAVVPSPVRNLYFDFAWGPIPFCVTVRVAAFTTK